MFPSRPGADSDTIILPTKLNSSAVITQMYAVAYQPEKNETANRWAIYVVPRQPDHGLCIKPVPYGGPRSRDTDGSTALIYVSQLSFNKGVPKDLTVQFPPLSKSFKINVREDNGGVTVGDLLGTLKAAKLHRYEFTTTARGCRYWISTFISVLERERLVADTWNSRTLFDALQATWDADGKRLEECLVIPGMFY